MGGGQIKTGLQLSVRQELHMTPQILQSMEILQMNAQELLDYLGRVVEENPLLERQEPAELQREYLQLRRQISWLNEMSRIADTADTYRETGGEDWERESLSAFLCDQLERLGLEERMLGLCCYLAELVDEDGYLSVEELSDVLKMGVPDALLHRAVRLLQSLEPAGVAAEDLSDCLALQLRRMEGETQLAQQVVNSCLAQLGRRQYGAIARKLSVSEREVRASAELISGLEPRPGRAFTRRREQTEYIRPDLFIAKMEEGWRVILNEYHLPRLYLSPYYTQLMRENQDRETAEYLKERLKKAKETLASLEKRKKTLQRCGEVMMCRQLPFFSGESDDLAPMSLRQLAEELECHPSTVSRALQGKYLQCARGTYPIRYFFSLPSGGTSRQAVQRRMAELIRQEDKAHPLSDEKLSILLKKCGVEVSRRTIAKYRTELGLPAASGRRKK